jgi:hypothetical protein
LASYYEFVNPRWIWRTLIVVGVLAFLAIGLDTCHKLDEIGANVAVAEYDRSILKVELRDMKAMLVELRETMARFGESRRRAVEALRDNNPAGHAR